MGGATERASELVGFVLPELERAYGSDDVELICQGWTCGERATSLRTNLMKATSGDVAAALDRVGIAYARPAWSSDAFMLTSGGFRDVAALPLYEEGAIYLQSLAAMIPVLMMGVRPGMDVLDMCAAPGGKTTQIASVTGGKAFITATEMHAPRAERLEFNLRRQGVTNCNLMRCDARNLDDYFSFDSILLDAPCSGSGPLDLTDARTPLRFTPDLVSKSVKRQVALLTKALTLLKPGATMVYSTCSILPRENQDVVRRVLADVARPTRDRAAIKAEVRPLDLPGLEEVPTLPCDMPGALLVRPTREYEGFFAVKIKRVS